MAVDIRHRVREVRDGLEVMNRYRVRWWDPWVTFLSLN